MSGTGTPDIDSVRALEVIFRAIAAEITDENSVTSQTKLNRNTVSIFILISVMRDYLIAR